MVDADGTVWRLAANDRPDMTWGDHDELAAGRPELVNRDVTPWGDRLIVTAVSDDAPYFARPNPVPSAGGVIVTSLDAASSRASLLRITGCGATDPGFAASGSCPTRVRCRCSRGETARSS